MKILDKIAFVIFSSIILILSILFCILIFGWINVSTVSIYLQNLLNNQIAINISLGISVILILLAIKSIFFSSISKSNKNNENGNLLQNENGKLFVSKDTIQSLVNGIVKTYKEAQEVTSKVIVDKENNINIEVVLFVTQEAQIKDLSNDLQIKIKELINKSIGIEIKEVNIKIRNVTPKQTSIQE